MKKIHNNKIKNFLSSIFAGWNEIFFNFIFQIFLVPIFLYNWETKYYSLWIIFLTVKGLIALINTAQRDLIYQKILSIGKHNKKMIIEYQSFIKNNFKNVGKNFAYEARSIHYNDKKKEKGIYGTISKKDLKELKEEGIDTQMVPWIEDNNN